MFTKSPQMIKKLLNTGFLHIFSSGVIARILLFCSSFLIVRILTVNEFGVFQAANNIVSMFMLVSGLGTLSAVFQFACENHDDKEKKGVYFRYGFKYGVWFNIIIMLFLALYSIVIPIEIEGVSQILLVMSALPIMNYFTEAIPIFLRSEFDNKGFSFFNALSSLFRVISLITLSWFFSIWGAVISLYISNIFSVLLIIIINKNFFNVFKGGTSLKKDEKKVFWKISIVSAMNNSLSQLLYNLDIFMMGIMIPVASVIAIYKTATLIPFALMFIPTTIVLYIYPYFAKHINDKKWLMKHYILIIKYLALFNFLISLILILFANRVIVLLFGSDYSESVLPFRILMAGYFFAATFRIISGNILVALRKVTFNLVISIFSGVLNIFLNYMLIRNYGSVGAAVSTFAIFLLTSIVSTVYLIQCIRNLK